MTALHVEQIIYTRVEADYSARLKSGFQVVYRGERLTQADIDQVEQRVQCFQAFQPGVIRRQFFVLPSGLAVITRSVIIESDPTITDRDRRRGAFIAHCLLLNKDDLAKLDYNPLPLFDACSWVNDPCDMVARFGKATGTAPMLVLDVATKPRRITSDWSLTEARKLVALALASPDLAATRRSVLLVGQSPAIEEAIDVAFALMPRAQRLACTFDTAIEGCGARPGQYWAVGATSRQSGAFMEVNANERRLVTTVAGRTDEGDLYLRWLARLPAHIPIVDAADRGAAMQALAAAVNRQIPWPSSGIDEEIAREFLALNRGRVGQILEARLAPLLGRHIAFGVAHHLINQEAATLALQWTVVPKFERRILNDLLDDWITQARPQLSDNDLRKLTELGIYNLKDQRL
jgi:hypothetical protein